MERNLEQFSPPPPLPYTVKKLLLNFETSLLEQNISKLQHCLSRREIDNGPKIGPGQAALAQSPNFFTRNFEVSHLSYTVILI